MFTRICICTVMYVSLCIRTQYYARTIYIMPDWQYIYCRFMYMSKQTTTIKQRLYTYVYVYMALFSKTSIALLCIALFSHFCQSLSYRDEQLAVPFIN